MRLGGLQADKQDTECTLTTNAEGVWTPSNTEGVWTPSNTNTEGVWTPSNAEAEGPSLIVCFC